MHTRRNCFRVFLLFCKQTSFSYHVQLVSMFSADAVGLPTVLVLFLSSGDPRLSTIVAIFHRVIT